MGFGVWGSGFRVSGLGFRGSVGFRVGVLGWGLGFGVEVLGDRVSGSGLCALGRKGIAIDVGRIAQDPRP